VSALLPSNAGTVRNKPKPASKIKRKHFSVGAFHSAFGTVAEWVALWWRIA
jgi:hypothetical protein